MNFGQTVEFIRHQKNFSIKQICGDYLSRQTYYRFVKNEIDISSKKLFYILNNLNVNVDEFLFISNNFQSPQEFLDMENLKLHFENKNTQKLNTLLDDYSTKSTIKEQVFHALISVLIGRLTNKHFEAEEQFLKTYLINIETWTHYETVLFNNSMFIFDNNFIELVFSKVNYNLNKYSTLRYYGNESIRMFINMIILYIDRQDLRRAKSTLETIKNLKINDDCLYEKSCILFFDEVLNFLEKKSTDLKISNSIISFFKTVGSTSIANMFELYIENLVRNFPINP
ncbi:TPA: Rgg/GadR/MutR family transcriptional regulator [Streptococcus suis]|nr:Rgg/GadR/MutR family transcriptional regulator [Streptococcus suis]